MKYPIYEFILNPESDHFTTALVKDPAVENTLMYFNAENEKPIFFANEEKRVIYSVAMRPNKLIFRKETDKIPAHYGFFSAESIEKFQENYAKHQGDKKVNVNHTETPIDGVFKIENWIVKDAELDKTKAIGLDAKAGDMIMAFKIDNNEVWEQCKNGNLDGLSIEASLGRKEVSTNFNNDKKMNKLEKVTKFFTELFADEVEETDEKKMAEKETPPASDYKAELEAENEMLKAKVTDLEAKLATMEADKVKEETELETMKKEVADVKAAFEKFKSETPAVAPIVNIPQTKAYEDMTPLEKFRAAKNN